MAIRQIESRTDVLTAARSRIKNVFSNGKPVYLSFSCGKDSLVMASITYDLIRNGEINPRQLVVVFIDEEGIYPSMEEAALRWRENFKRVGAEFWWFCLPVKQVSVIDNLSASESWITWEASKKDVWIRQPPDFAIMSHPYLEYEGQMNYQTFCDKLTADGFCIVGLRTQESLMRLQSLSRQDLAKVNTNRKVYPIYDWTDGDVWLYIKERGLEFPKAYIMLYEQGVPKRNLRLCAFFGDCGMNGLLWVSQTDPELWERIERRMPNAYLAVMYWDSEMFARQTKARTDNEKDEEKKDYRKLANEILFHPENFNIPSDTLRTIKIWRNFYKKVYELVDESDCKRIYETILRGDSKLRGLRALQVSVNSKYIKREF